LLLLVVRSQEVVAIALARLAAVPICLAALVLSILSIGVVPVGTIMLMLVLRLDHAPGSEEDARDQREIRQPQDRTHRFASLFGNCAFQRRRA
jgi:hypothetical protein